MTDKAPHTNPIELIAQACHEANRAHCQSIGDDSQPAWEDAPEWQRSSAVNGVVGALAGNTPRQSHESWLREKRDTGWVYGEVKDPEAKTHPCMVDYDDLPPEQQAKDGIFVGTVRRMAQELRLVIAEPSEKVAPAPLKARTLRIVSDGTSNGTFIFDADGNRLTRAVGVVWRIEAGAAATAAVVQTLRTEGNHIVRGADGERVIDTAEYSGVEVDVVATDAEVVTESVEDARARRLGFAKMDDTPVEVARSYLRAVETAVRGLQAGMVDLSRLVDVGFDFGDTPDTDGGETDGA